MVRRPYLVTILTIGVLALALLVVPPAKRPTPPPRTDDRVVSGAFHVHTSRSDGMRSVPDVAAAAARAGLDFVILADHGDGTRAPEAPRYLDHVLLLDAVEISTRHGHYVAVGLPAVPFPLGGDGRDVATDVRRFGGFGVIAHPTSPKSDLRWTEGRNVQVDGIEWINSDSEWRDESSFTLVRALLRFPFGPAETLASMLDRPTDAIAEWDARLADHPVVGIPGADAHGGIRWDDTSGTADPPPAPGTIEIPGYEATFRAFSLRLRVDQPLTGDASLDAQLVESALRRGRLFSVIDGLAAPGRVEFAATSGSGRAGMGELLRFDGPVEIIARLEGAPGVELVLIRDGVEWHREAGPTLRHRFDAEQSTSIRLEGRLAGAPGVPPVPWIVTNPIYIRVVDHPTGIADEPAGEPLPSGDVPRRLSPSAGVAWALETDRSSRGDLDFGSNEGVRLHYVLGQDGDPSPFVAMRVALDTGVTSGHAIRFKAWADRACRLSVQLRASAHGTRWQRSVYIDDVPAWYSVAVADMRPVDPAADSVAPGPEGTEADTLLFVIDTVNARPGDSGMIEVTVAEVLGPAASDQVRTPSNK